MRKGRKGAKRFFTKGYKSKEGAPETAHPPLRFYTYTPQAKENRGTHP